MAGKTFIFDFDGTLADTFPLIVDVAYRLAPSTKRLTAAQINELRRYPLLHALLRLGISWVYMPHLIRHTRKELTRDMEKVTPFSGVPEMLTALHKAGHQLFILSSNYPKNIRRFLRYHKLEKHITEIDGVSWGNTIFKSLALRSLVHRYGLDPASCYHVGNESLDIRAARRAGMRGIAVNWSGFSEEALKRSRPFALVNTPKDILKLVQ